jgi:hypothetical protein
VTKEIEIPPVITAVRNRESIIFSYYGKQEERIIVKINDFIPMTVYNSDSDYLCEVLRAVATLKVRDSSVVYFNVEGEIIPMLRSVILRYIPDSLLGIRTSRRWKEEESWGE